MLAASGGYGDWWFYIKYKDSWHIILIGGVDVDVRNYTPVG